LHQNGAAKKSRFLQIFLGKMQKNAVFCRFSEKPAKFLRKSAKSEKVADFHFLHCKNLQKRLIFCRKTEKQ